MPFQSCCSDEVCGWKPLAVTSPHVVMSHKGERSVPGPKENKLNPLIAREPQGINAIVDEEWVEIEAAIDSGATATVMSEKTFAGAIDITEGPAMKRGVTYEVADGTEIPNLGERKFFGFTEEGGRKGE